MVFHLASFFFFICDVFNFIIVLGESDPPITHLNMWIHHSCEMTVFCFYTHLSLHWRHNVLCHVVLPWKKTGLKWTSRNKQGNKEEGRRQRLRQNQPPLTHQRSFFHPHAVASSPCLFKGWLAAPACHTMKTAQKWLLWKPSPQDASVISASQIYQAAEWHCRSISDCFDGDCIISCHPFFPLFVLYLCSFASPELGLSPLFLSNNSRFDNWCREPFQTQRTGGREQISRFKPSPGIPAEQSWT